MNPSNDEHIILIDLLEEILGNYKNHYHGKQQISFDCPVCSYEIKGLDDGDGKGNLEINYGLGVFKCWACGETHETHGSIYRLIKRFGNKNQLKKFIDFDFDFDFEIAEQKFQKVKLPKEYIKFNDASYGLKLTHYYKRAYNYLKKRNITDEMIKKYRIGFCYEGKYANRIIIPSYDEFGRLDYFISRSYLPYTKKKYDNPNAPKEQFIWGLDLIDWDKPVYLVEGVFDHIFLLNSIPLLGKKISDNLFGVLYKNAKEIIIVLDGDAWEDTEKNYHKLNGGKLYNKIRAIKLPENEDVASLKGEINNFKKIKLHR